MEQGQKCALRALSLCDGHSVASLDARSSVACWCSELTAALADQEEARAAVARHARARTVARADRIQRLMAQRQQWLGVEHRTPF